MILTDKAKEDFLEWNEKNEETFLLSYSDREITSLTIEWLDNIGIFVALGIDSVEDYGFAFYAHVNEYNLNTTFISRKDATTKAIEHANKIYNNGIN